VGGAAFNVNFVRMGVETREAVHVDGFTEGQRKFLDFHRDKVLLKAIR